MRVVCVLVGCVVVTVVVVVLAGVVVVVWVVVLGVADVVVEALAVVAVLRERVERVEVVECDAVVVLVARAMPVVADVLTVAVGAVLARDGDPPPHAATSAASPTPTARAPARLRILIGACDGCHSQSPRSTDMVRRDGSESDGP